MKIVVCVFSYKADATLCGYALESVELIKKRYPEHDIKTALINDSNDLIEENRRPKTDIYKETNFNRGKSLMGGDCIRGQIKVYSEIFSEADADVLIKLDSDTTLESLDWLWLFNGFGAGMWGATSDIYPSIFGACYAISRQTVDGISFLLSRAVLGNDAAEDRAITRLAEISEELGIGGKVATNFYHSGHSVGIVNQTENVIAGKKAIFRDVWCHTFGLPGSDKAEVERSMRNSILSVNNTPKPQY